MTFQDNGIKIKTTPQKHLWVLFYKVYGLVAAKSSWVDPIIFVAVKSNTPLLYFIKLSGQTLDFNLLVGTHLKR